MGGSPVGPWEAGRPPLPRWGAGLLAFPACLTPEPCPHSPGPPPRLVEVNKATAGELPGRALSACACGQVVWPAVSQHPMTSRHNKGIPSPLAATHLNDILSGRQSRWGTVAWVSSGPGAKRASRCQGGRELATRICPHDPRRRLYWRPCCSRGEGKQRTGSLLALSLMEWGTMSLFLIWG